MRLPQGGTLVAPIAVVSPHRAFQQERSLLKGDRGATKSPTHSCRYKQFIGSAGSVGMNSPRPAESAVAPMSLTPTSAGSAGIRGNARRDPVDGLGKHRAVARLLLRVFAFVGCLKGKQQEHHFAL